MTRIWADFNSRDERWFVPTLLTLGEKQVTVDETVVARDHEGNYCEARVAEVDEGKGVVFLALYEDTFVAAALPPPDQKTGPTPAP